MPASIAGLPGRAGRIGTQKGIVALRRLASRRPCHAQAAFAGEQGGSPLGSPLGRSPLACLWKKVKEKIDFGGFARRGFPLRLRSSLLSPPHGLRPNARETRANQCYAPEFSRMTGNSHSQFRADAPVFARNGSTRFLTRIALWQNEKGARLDASGWFSNHQKTCRPTIPQSPISAFATSSACWRGKPRANSSKPNGSAHPATTSRIREIAA